MIILKNRKLVYTQWGFDVEISKVFRNKDPDQNIKDANEYMADHPNEGVIETTSDYKSIYLAEMPRRKNVKENKS
jgi:hypothetical protein